MFNRKTFCELQMIFIGLAGISVVAQIYWVLFVRFFPSSWWLLFSVLPVAVAEGFRYFIFLFSKKLHLQVTLTYDLFLPSGITYKDDKNDLVNVTKM